MSRTAKEIETTGLPCEAQNGETIQVVPKINVTMFGKFTLKQEGMEVPHAVSLTGRSRRLWTLTAYLILNRNRGVSAQELIDLLWPEAENDNPLSTLQNNVSRARAALYREVYGVSPSAELEAQKALAVQELYGSETSEDDIHTFLLEKEQEPGAFCCDNNVFREIVNLHVREMRRNDTPAALMIVRLANRSIDPEKRAIYMKQMEGTLLNELRAGDPFTKVGANQFWVLLPGATGENGGLVSRRVFNRFQKEYPKSGAAYTFKSLDLRHIHMSAEEKATEKTERRKA